MALVVVTIPQYHVSIFAHAFNFAYCNYKYAPEAMRLIIYMAWCGR